jgi:hypothetical protein
MIIAPFYQNLQIFASGIEGWNIASFDVVFQCEGMEEPTSLSFQIFVDANLSESAIDTLLMNYALLNAQRYCNSEWQLQLQMLKANEVK